MKNNDNVIADLVPMSIIIHVGSKNLAVSEKNHKKMTDDQVRRYIVLAIGGVFVFLLFVSLFTHNYLLLATSFAPVLFTAVGKIVNYYFPAPAKE